jgi:hypothetical protein
MKIETNNTPETANKRNPQLFDEYRLANINPEYYRLSQLSYDHFITIKEHSNNRLFSGTNGKAESFRKMTAGRFCSFFRIKLGLRGKDLIWVTREEYGMSQNGHMHILVKILKGSKKYNVSQIDWSAFNLTDFKTLNFDIDVKKIGETDADQKKVVSYFCKKEHTFGGELFNFSNMFISKCTKGLIAA